jgi:hypothetical protein
MTQTETSRVKAYTKAEKRAVDQLEDWETTFALLQARGLSQWQIKAHRKQLERNSKGVF